MPLNHNQRYLLEEFAEDYQARELSRRDLLRRAISVTGSVTVAATALLALGCSSSAQPAATPTTGTSTGETPSAATTAATGPTVAPNDAALLTEDVSFDGPASKLLGYLARPAAAGTYPGVLIIHENQGLLEHFKDVARRYAKEGFAALAVDLVSRNGGSGPDPVANMAVVRIDPDDLVTDLKGYVGYLKGQSFVKAGGVGVMGFCFGGNETWDIAIASPDVTAATPFYGSVRQFDRLGETHAAIYAFYGGDDTRITSQSDQVKQTLQAAGKTIEIKIYPGAGHAFFNDTKPSYNAAAAADAWTQTLTWMRRYVGV